MGLPLLSHPKDYHDIVQCLKETFQKRYEGLLVGHGQDHPKWWPYVARFTYSEKREHGEFNVGFVERVTREMGSGGKKMVCVV